ncbi:Peptidase A17 and DUF1759 and DUF1758 domain cont aining protein [Trichuris trichiura]|uniref:Peptidase A17 and DUF1759 and DUF1758 domain cont aining protein n=1 Tax=Trichuris trichiura TaxID=36087 RepID=A0A077ZDY5_TRITR|nr:Peptidase A17 and DUF1759 and DUF1758 domain cont aining protein [Trichuris trichiura]
MERDIRALRVEARQYIEKSKEQTLSAKEVYNGGACAPALPKWDLPKFKGDVLLFTVFWDQFEAGVHSRSDLRTCLEGIAFDAIAGYSETAANYAAAVATLKSRFGRPNLIAEKHILELMQTEKCNRPTARELRQVHDTVARNVRALVALNKDPLNETLGRGAISSAQAETSSIVRKLWESKVLPEDQEELTLDAFVEFLQSQVEIEEAAVASEKEGCKNKRRTEPSELEQRRRKDWFSSAAALQATVHKRNMCSFCSGEHENATCQRFKNVGVKGRWKMVRENRACFLCLGSGHQMNECSKKVEGVQYHPMLVKKRRREKGQASEYRKVQVDLVGMPTKGRVLLQTARAVMRTMTGDRTVVISQRSFITEELANRMRLNGPLEYVEISTLGGQSKFCKRTRRVQFAFSALDSGEQRAAKQWRTANPLLQRRWKHLHGLKLADQFPRECSKIDVLIGLDYYYDFVSQEVRHGHAGEPVALRTLFGWIVCGTMGEGNKDPNEILRKLWDLEALGIRDAEEARRRQSTEAIRHYIESITFEGERYVVRLPWKTDAHHARLHIATYKRAAEEVLSNMFVDDFLSSCADSGEAEQLVDQLRKLMQLGGFNLTKWKCNSSSVAEAIGVTDVTVNNDRIVSKVLGVPWNLGQDALSFITPHGVISKSRETKRELLSAVAKIFDPMGFLAPFTIRAKIILQSLWQSGTGWDESIPDVLNAKWSRWKQDLHMLPQLLVQRTLIPVDINAVRSIELHAFADASEKAYGAVVYMKVVIVSANNFVDMVIAKSHLAPLKKITLPRRELIAALVAARLVCYVKREIEMTVDRVACWSDSKVALSWIRSPSKSWKPFVQKRVQEIQALVDSANWYHCAGKDNPADLLSRGTTIENLKSNSYWWHGPAWLKMPEGSWPKDDKMSELTDVHAQTVKQEGRKKIVGLLAEQSSDVQYALVLRYSSFERLLRITAWLFRFVKNCRLPKEMRNYGLISVEELLQAERQVQKEYFEDEINCIVKHKALRSSSKLLMFDPYLDEDGLLRVGGRLESASIQEAAKRQILLPHNHVVVDLLVRRCHERQLHADVQHTLAILRQRVWILRARSCVERNIRNCVVCKAQRTVPVEQKMSSLPVERVKVAFALENTGLDFAGPIYVRRRRTCEKAYICLFTCMTTRAIHLELVTDMTAARFVLALRRFFARRGRPAIIQSDNFKTFKSASRELQQLFSEDNSERFDEPPRTLEIYNRESTLDRWILGTVGEISERPTTKDSWRASLDEEETRTVLCNVDAMVSARLLTFVGDDPKDLAISRHLIF